MLSAQSLTPIPDRPEFDIFFISESIASLKADKPRFEALIATLNERISNLQNDFTVNHESVENKIQQVLAQIQAMDMRVTDIEARIEHGKEQLNEFKKETAKAAALTAEKLEKKLNEPVYDPAADLATMKKLIEKSDHERKADIAKQDAMLSAQMSKLEAAQGQHEVFEAQINERIQVYFTPNFLSCVPALFWSYRMNFFAFLIRYHSTIRHNSLTKS